MHNKRFKKNNIISDVTSHTTVENRQKIVRATGSVMEKIPFKFFFFFLTKKKKQQQQSNRLHFSIIFDVISKKKKTKEANKTHTHTKKKTK